MSRPWRRGASENQGPQSPLVDPVIAPNRGRSRPCADRARGERNTSGRRLRRGEPIRVPVQAGLPGWPTATGPAAVMLGFSRANTEQGADHGNLGPLYREQAPGWREGGQYDVCCGSTWAERLRLWTCPALATLATLSGRRSGGRGRRRRWPGCRSQSRRSVATGSCSDRQARRGSRPRRSCAAGRGR